MNRPLIRIALRPTGTLSFWKGFKWSLIVIVAIAVAIVARLVQIEIETSRLQARFLSELTRDVGYSVDEGASNRIRFPDNGPYDLRLGYALLPSFQQRLLSRGFVVASQARVSDRMLSLADERLFLPYGEKDQAGLSIVDSTGSPLFGVVYPHHAYVDFDTIPPLVVQSLLFIEDRYLLDPSQPNRNPAIDWGRFSRALADQGLRFVNRPQATPGGSTLATQLEKFRHSPDGRTATPPEKLRQIASASVRAYLNGPQTMAARHAIVVHYLNSVPLAARARVGEITGIGDGLAAWYGRDFDEVNRLRAAPPTPAHVAAQGVAFRQVLSRLIAPRAPDFIVSIYFDYILDDRFIELPGKDSINLHPGYLPYNKGFYYYAWAVLDGTPAGVSIHRIVSAVDAGPIISQKRVLIDGTDTGDVIYDKHMDASVELFRTTWPSIESGTYQLFRQRHKGTRKKITETNEAMEIDPNATYVARELIDLLRVFCFRGSGGCVMKIDGKKYSIGIEFSELADNVNQIRGKRDNYLVG